MGPKGVPCPWGSHTNPTEKKDQQKLALIYHYSHTNPVDGKKSCTSWFGKYHDYSMGFIHPGGTWFLPSTGPADSTFSSLGNLPCNLRNPSIPLELVLAPEGSREAWEGIGWDVGWTTSYEKMRLYIVPISIGLYHPKNIKHVWLGKSAFLIGDTLITLTQMNLFSNSC